uniref:Uncharacterized protein n=1 Tax=Myoviridae sp. ct04y17 TaxID=2827652 RepID=A0A8S5SIJ0_9CAUD|nr:MAG TPA: hypothetical protein [Myoviridae sp. ct04y17]
MFFNTQRYEKILECETILLIIIYIKLLIHLIYTYFTIVVFINVHFSSLKLNI